jgi:hypothetical protein
MPGIVYTSSLKYFLIGFVAFLTPIKEVQSLKYFIHNVHVKCISKAETKSNDLIYVRLISKDCDSKNTPTKAFKNGDRKVFTEINLDDLGRKSGWCVKGDDVLKFMTKDASNEDEVIFEIKFTKELLLKQHFNYIKNLTMGKYEISFELKSIKLE